jgi:hypothetical protein
MGISPSYPCDTASVTVLPNVSLKTDSTSLDNPLHQATAEAAVAGITAMTNAPLGLRPRRKVIAWMLDQSHVQLGLFRLQNAVQRVTSSALR